MKYQAVLGFVALTLAAACGSTDKPPALATEPGSGGTGGTSVTHTGGKGGKGGGGGKAGSGGDAGEAGGARSLNEDGGLLAPTVTITSPVAVKDPNVGPVILNDGVKEVEVVCKAVASHAPGAQAVEASSVSIEMVDAAGASTVQPGTSTTNVDEYSTQFIVSKVPNGALSFTCRANDLGGHQGSEQVQTLIDHGPDITRGQPTADSPHPSGTMKVDFTVTPAPLTKSGDRGADVDTVTLQINGQTIDLSAAADPASPGHYQLDVDLTPNNPLFPTKLNGSIAIVITATNKRGAVQSDTYHFIVDGQGPTIAISSPTENEIIGGKRTLQFVVSDTDSGVNPDSVIVTVNQDAHSYDTKGLWTKTLDAQGSTHAVTYTFSLDSATITGATVQISVNIAATDLAGNPAPGVSATYYLDTQRPIVDMDPPMIQEVKESGGIRYCSQPFDPLGKVASDMVVVQSFTTFRALAWDITNRAAGIQLERFSGVDPSTVFFYAQGDPSKGLLVDMDGDGICDDIDPNLTLPLKNMYPVSPNQGNANFVGSPGIANVCSPGIDTSPPDPLCNKGSDLTRVIQREQIGGNPEAVVYSLVPSLGECNDSQLQLSSMSGVTTNGWVCLAVRAVDRAKNIGISAPLRVCLNAAENGPPPACASMSTTPPSCTTNCTPPPHFRPATLTYPHPYILEPGLY